MGGDTKKQQQLATREALLQMITYIKDHPSGYDEDAMLWFIKEWTVVEKNFGEARYFRGKYINIIKGFKLDAGISADLPMPTGDPDDPDTAPKLSQTLYHKLNNLMNQVFNDNVYAHTLPFNQAQGALATFVYGFEIKLAQQNPERAKKFRHRLGVLSHQLN
jgi:hypothetical protein